MCLNASSGVPEMTPVVLSRTSPFGRSGITVNRSIPPLVGAINGSRGSISSPTVRVSLSLG